MDESGLVSTYLPLVEEAFRRRRPVGTWPAVEKRQRWADQHSIGLDSDSALRESLVSDRLRLLVYWILDPGGRPTSRGHTTALLSDQPTGWVSEPAPV